MRIFIRCINAYIIDSLNDGYYACIYIIFYAYKKSSSYFPKKMKEII